MPGTFKGDFILRFSKKHPASVISFLLLFFFSCSSTTDFKITDLAKTNIDDITEIHLNQTTELLKILTHKLYKRNPKELKKAAGETIDSRIAQIFTCPVKDSFDEIEKKTGSDAILLGLEPDYPGDRVFAVMFGLYTMVLKAYDSKCEFFILDALNEQHLYNCARNIEILVWRLKTRLDENGVPLILSNSTNGDVQNLSYERIFGKLISLQDTMALIVSKRSGRIIKEVVQFAGMTFLPIGL